MKGKGKSASERCEFPGCGRHYLNEHSRRQHYRRAHGPEWASRTVRRRPKALGANSSTNRNTTTVTAQNTEPRGLVQRELCVPELSVFGTQSAGNGSNGLAWNQSWNVNFMDTYDILGIGADDERNTWDTRQNASTVFIENSRATNECHYRSVTSLVKQETQWDGWMNARPDIYNGKQKSYSTDNFTTTSSTKRVSKSEVGHTDPQAAREYKTQGQFRQPNTVPQISSYSLDQLVSMAAESADFYFAQQPVSQPVTLYKNGPVHDEAIPMHVDVVKPVTTSWPQVGNYYTTSQQDPSYPVLTGAALLLETAKLLELHSLTC